MVGVGEQQRERALEAVEHGQRAGPEVPGGLTVVVGAGEQVRGDLGVGDRLHLDTVPFEFLPERGEVLDDPVVDDRDLPVEGDVRVRVLVGGATVGGPAGVADGGVAGQVVAPGLRDLVHQVRQLSGAFDGLDTTVIADDGDTRGIVSAVLHPTQRFQGDVETLLFTYISNDSTHADHISGRRHPAGFPHTTGPVCSGHGAACPGGAAAGPSRSRRRVW